MPRRHCDWKPLLPFFDPILNSPNPLGMAFAQPIFKGWILSRGSKLPAGVAEIGLFLVYVGDEPPSPAVLQVIPPYPVSALANWEVYGRWMRSDDYPTLEFRSLIMESNGISYKARMVRLVLRRRR
jgi:hypothetical protein